MLLLSLKGRLLHSTCGRINRFCLFLLFVMNTRPLHVQAPGLIITPHIGGAVVNIRVRGYRFVVEQIERFASGQPLENVRMHGY